jgi:subtilisin family serine protease
MSVHMWHAVAHKESALVPIRWGDRVLKRVVPVVATLAIVLAGMPVGASSAHHARVRPLAQLALSNAARGHRLPSTLSPSEGSSVSSAVYGIFLTGSVTAAEIAATGARAGTIEPVGATAYGTLGQLQALAQLPGVNEVDIAGAPQKELDQSVPATHAAEPGHAATAGVPHMWSGTGGSTATPSTLTGDTGKNVVVGVVDSGIDLSNADFKTSAGTRIKSQWDQSGNSPNPIGFGYGAECTSATIDGGTCTETDAEGHGTHVAGIAASNGRAGTGGQYIGMAPESDIVAVKIDPARGTLANIVDGVKYVYQKAAALGEPASVNLSLGVGFGPHDGTSLFEQLLDGLTGPGKLLSVAAGNTGRHVAGSGSNNGLYYHASGNVPQGQTRALNLRIGGSEPVLFDLWYPAGEQLGVTVRGPIQNNNLPYVTPNDPVFGNPQGGNGYVGSCGSDPASTVRGASYTDPSTGNIIQIVPCQGVPGSIDSETQVFISNFNGSSGPGGCPCFENWSISLQGTAVSSGAFNAWTFDQGDYFVSNNGANSSNLGNDSGTLSPPATAHNVIAVGSSTDRSTWTDQYGHLATGPLVASGRSQVGALSFFSSLGPTRDGRRGIDIVAPGEMIGSSLSANAGAAILQGCGVTDTVNGQPACLSSDGAHLFIQGTSMASPHVAGALALILQQVPTLTVAQARRVLADSAGVDGNTGGVPNASWGTGKLQLGPGVTSVTPLHAARNTSPNVTLCGFDFQPGMTGAYRATGTSTFTSPVPVTVQSGCFSLTLAPATRAGTVDFRLTNPDTSTGTDTASFTFDYAGPWRVAGIGGDNAPWSEDAGDTNFNTLGGAALGAPALYSDSLTGGSGQIVTGGDHDLWVNNGVAGWQRLTSGGPVYCIDNPAAVIPPGSSTLYVGCQGGDHALWTAVTSAPAWGVNPSVPASAWHRAGGVLTAGPAVAPVDTSVQFFVLGGDNHVWTSNSGTTAFTQMSWLCQGHPAVATTNKANSVTFFACHGSDGALWWAKRPTGGAWGAASSLGGLIVDGPAVGAISATGSPIFFAEGSDRHMWTRTDSPGWSPLGGIFQHGAGAIGS